MKTREDELCSLIPRIIQGDRTVLIRAEVLFSSLNVEDKEKILRPFLQLYETDEAKKIENLSTAQQAMLGYLFWRAEMYEQALLYVKPAVEKGDPFAQNILGGMYQDGEGVVQDDLEGIRLLQLSAQQGDCFGQENLAHAYYIGNGVVQNDREAVKLYRLAAEQGNPSAQYCLGDMRHDGRGMPKDDREAVRLFQLSAHQGYSDAQNRLGEMHFNGHGVDKNYEEAVRWYELAAKQGNANGRFNLGCMYENGHGVPQNYAEAMRLYTLAMEQGHSRAPNNLGVMYHKGHGVARDFANAAYFFRLSAELDNKLAFDNLVKTFKSQPTPLVIYEACAALLNCGKLKDHPDVITAFQKVAQEDFDNLRLWLATENIETIERLKKSTIIESFFKQLPLQEIQEQDAVMQKFQDMKRGLPQGVISHIMSFLGVSPEESAKRRDVIHAIHKIREEKNLEEAKVLNVLLKEFDQALSSRSAGLGAGSPIESKHPELQGEVKGLLARLAMRLYANDFSDLEDMKRKFLDALNKHRLSGANISAFEMRDEKAITEKKAITLEDLNKHLKEKVSSPKKTFRS